MGRKKTYITSSRNMFCLSIFSNLCSLRFFQIVLLICYSTVALKKLWKGVAGYDQIIIKTWFTSPHSSNLQKKCSFGVSFM